jgi:hypothetical protein
MQETHYQMIKRTREMLNMIKKVLKERFLKDELRSMSQGANTLTSKMIEIEARIINLESENEELKTAFGNLTVAYLDIVNTLYSRSTTEGDGYSQDDYLDKMLNMFNYEESDDDLPN